MVASTKAFTTMLKRSSNSIEELPIPIYALRNVIIDISYVYESILQDPTLKVPANISHIRSLHKFSPDARRSIWRLATASGQPITEDLVSAAIVKFGTPMIILESGVQYSDISNELYVSSELLDVARQMVPDGIFDLDPARFDAFNS